MAHVDVALPTDQPPPESPAPAKKTPIYVNILAGVAIIALSAFIFSYGQTLYAEWKSLQREEDRAKHAAVIGYVDITPRLSYAKPPKEWFRQETDAHFLWSRWHQGKHEWFKFAPGDIDIKLIHGPEGRDSIRAIEHPIVEMRGGEHFDRVPEDARVAGLEFKGKHMAYPVVILERVRAVNQEVDGAPLVIIWRPFTNADEAANAYDATLDGRRLTFGTSGYYSGTHTPHRPLMYDHTTESFWMENDEGLTSVAGKSKGATLKRMHVLPNTSWATWRAQHPGSGLVIGADRTTPSPAL